MSKSEVALRRREQPEVRQVGVAAELDRDAGGRRRREVGRHRQRRAAIERERRHGHPAIADRHEVRHPGRGLLLEERDRIRAVGRRPSSRRGPPAGLAPWLRRGPPAVVARGNRGFGHAQPSPRRRPGVRRRRSSLLVRHRRPGRVRPCDAVGREHVAEGGEDAVDPDRVGQAVRVDQSADLRVQVADREPATFVGRAPP